MTNNSLQLERARTDKGFIAALDQSGGSTPKVLKLYGVEESEYSGVEEMFDKVHAMRTRIMSNLQFNGSKILGAILFENTMDRTVKGLPTTQYLWEKKNVIPFLKVDEGLEEEKNGVQMMKPIKKLDRLLKKSVLNNVFGTKMRSVIKIANPIGIKTLVQQQFEISRKIITHGLVPIVEPEIDIHSDEKAEAEECLLRQLITELDLMKNGHVILKLTLPESNNLYKLCVDHPNVLRVVALSGGYSREEANHRLRHNHGIIASFSRAFLEGLSIQQSDTDFNKTIKHSIDTIAEASMT